MVFADGILILPRSPDFYRFPDNVRWVVAEIYAWKFECSFKFSYDMYKVFPPKWKMENKPSRVIIIDRHKVKLSRQNKYLRLVFDWDYS